jgi:mono/diheme cytochrome c family protein
MIASFKSATGVAACAMFLVTLAPALARAQQVPSQPSQPFGPDWGMLAGWDVFVKKGCGKCHAIRGAGGGSGPDLARIQEGRSFFELGAAMWNHVPRMGDKMRELGVERPTLTGQELSNLIAFLFTAQYYDELGSASAGEKVFTAKGCVQCHEVGGKGGHVGPPLDGLKRANSPVLVSAAMWNHGPEMAESMKAKNIPRPAFQGREMVDLIAYIVAAAKDNASETMQVIPGTPARGEQVFTDKQCAVCHAVGGKGGKVGPELGRPEHHVSLTRFAALMWNHGPTMWAKMKERGIQFPRLTGQEMADILAYLYTAHYFDQRGVVQRGQQLVQSKGCLGCHSVRGKGGKLSADFASSSAVSSPSNVIAAMWNHASYMESHAQKQAVSWPILSGQELADLSSYLTSLTKLRSSKPQRR